MPKYFFRATQSAHSQITRVFDFVWPTAAAMWNLRWQVEGFTKVVPGATVTQLNARFTEGAGIHGANLKRACIEHTWDEQKEAFGRIVLTNTIAIYEGWIEEVLTGLGKNTKALQLAFQSPDQKTGSLLGVSAAIAALTADESGPLRDAFSSALKGGRYYALPELNAMLTCYRFFKELRNCDMHRGGIADHRLIAAYTQFTGVATPGDLGVQEVPIHLVPTIGCPVRISLRGVVGFSGMLFKIIATLDAELSRSKSAERVFAERWRETNRHPQMFSSVKITRERQIKKLTEKAGFPEPSNPSQFGDWLARLGTSRNRVGNG